MKYDKKAGKYVSLNDDDREGHIINDEALYNWQRSSRKSMRDFIRENRVELDEMILSRINNPGPNPGRKYG